MKTGSRDIKQDQKWMLLIHQLPPQPTNLRVRIWRKLQKLGAAPVKNSVYVLPFNEKTREDFQWLKQEIESSGGEAAVFRADAVEGKTDREIIAAFRNARNEDYAQATADMDALAKAVRDEKRGGHLSTGRISYYEAEFDKFHKELGRIISTDFFDASGRASAMAASERCRKILRGAHRREFSTSPPRGAMLSPVQYAGRRWMTRRNLFIDRLAAIWLIKRFIDPKARFFFLDEGETIEGAIGFDMYGGEFTHQGEDCTFETMIRRFGLSDDAGLRALSEIVHDIDLKDGKFNRTEAAGLSSVVRGLAESLKDDRRLAQTCQPVFDGLYELLRREHETRIRKAADKKRRVAGRRRKR
ncbi:MAG: chromate resistance protein ChrB domain-containing protein [Acidobacteriota bacterium]